MQMSVFPLLLLYCNLLIAASQIYGQPQIFPSLCGTYTTSKRDATNLGVSPLPFGLFGTKIPSSFFSEVESSEAEAACLLTSADPHRLALGKP